MQTLQQNGKTIYEITFQRQDGASKVIYGDTFNIRITDSVAASMFLEYADARRQERGGLPEFFR